MKFAHRISLIKPSPTLAIANMANKLRAQGRDVIGFGAGEPDFDTPESIKQAAVRAIDEGFTKYTAVGGTDELKDAIIAKLRRDHGLEYERGEIVVSCGAKHSIYNLAQVLFEEGDEVIIPSPYYVSYPDMIALSGAQSVFVSTNEAEGFKMSPAALQAAITPRTRALILNSPCNPTGIAYTRAELKALAAVLEGTDVLVISDDIYEKIVYDGFEFTSIASLSADMKKRTIVVNGMSKTYAMTGWRIGYAAGDAEIMANVTKLQSQNTSNPTSISQKAAVEALNGDQSTAAVMAEEFRRRRDVIVEGLNAIPGMTCTKPAGAFYVFPNVSALFGKSWNGQPMGDSTAVTSFLLDGANVAVVPGADFGDDRYIRLSYATSMQNIVEGIKRIGEAVQRLG